MPIVSSDAQDSSPMGLYSINILGVLLSSFYPISVSTILYAAILSFKLKNIQFFCNICINFPIQSFVSCHWWQNLISEHSVSYLSVFLSVYVSLPRSRKIYSCCLSSILFLNVLAVLPSIWLNLANLYVSIFPSIYDSLQAKMLIFYLFYHFNLMLYTKALFFEQYNNEILLGKRKQLKGMIK